MKAVPLGASRIARLIGVVLVLVWLVGCATRNVIHDGEDANLMLHGNDPVAYFTMQRAIKGAPTIKAEHDGLTYRFVSEAHREMFLASPARFVPAYGGFCASGVHYGLKAKIGSDWFKVVDGRLFLFGSDRSRKHWELDEKVNIALADQYWENEVRDAPYRLQNLKRMLFKVPHYKTNADLEAEYQRRYGRPSTGG